MSAAADHSDPRSPEELLFTSCGLTASARRDLLAAGSLVRYPKMSVVQPIGHRCSTIYIIAQGCARIFYEKDGGDVTESLEFEGALLVRFESLFRGKASRKGIQVLEDSLLYKIDAQALEALRAADAGIDRCFRALFEQAHIETLERLESFQFLKPEERYRQLLELEPALLQRIPLKYIASYLGITQVSLSRIRARI